MNLRSEIFEWSKRQPLWRRDLMRRVAGRPTLSGEDEKVVLATLLAEHGGDPAGDTPKPLALEDLPGRQAASRLLLESLTEILNVNGLADNQQLAFGAGLNVIYGPTGAGKSSYTRIFKRSCRSVDDEPVLGNVYTGDTTPPQATITIKTGTGREVLRTDLTAEGPAALSSVMVFDGRCGKIYASDETVAFTPMTLRIFDRLAASQTQLRDLIDDQIGALARRAPSFADIGLGTQARRLVDEMSADTDVSALELFAQLDAKATVRLSELEVALARLMQSGPEMLAARAEREATAVESLLGRLEWVERGLAPETAATLTRARNAVTSTTAAVEAAAAAFASEPLPATGSAGWLLMWNSARQFLEHDCAASFPPEEGAVCPFCQQAVRADASARIARLEQFVTSAVERDAEKARKTLERELTALDALAVHELAHLPGLAILELEEPAAHTAVASFIETARVRAQALLAAQDADVPVAPSESLKAFIAARRVNAAAQRELVDPEHQRALTIERNELRARQQLATRIEDVRRWHRTQVESALLVRARRSLNTSAITRKQSELAKVAVSEALRRRVLEELDAFGFGYLKIEITSRGKKGQTKLRTALAGCKEPSERVLSTGEARGVSLAFFLAELACSDDTAPIIVDDPTSSFDQDHRRHFARRLTEEGARRQVVVLTHDITLLHELETHSEVAGIEFNRQALRRVAGRPGISEADLPWVATRVKGRRGVLNDRMQNLEKLHRVGDPEYDDQARLAAELLRETWERSIEERVLNDAINRFDPGVQTKRLSDSAVDPDVVRRIDEGMTETSRWVHDQPRGAPAAVPTPEELKKALAHLDEFLAALAR